VNDFGTADYFSVQTLTTGIFSVWRQGRNLGGAAQIAMCILMIIVLLVGLEKAGRRGSKFSNNARSQRPVAPTALRGMKAVIAFSICVFPVLIGFVFPVAVILSHAFDAQQWAAPGLISALIQTLTICAIAATLTVLGAIFMVYGVRLSGRRLPSLLMPVTALGYAAPGAVLALGILVPLAAFDNRVADLVLAVTGTDPGLLMTGSAGALIFAFGSTFAWAQRGRNAPCCSHAACAGIGGVGIVVGVC